MVISEGLMPLVKRKKKSKYRDWLWGYHGIIWPAEDALGMIPWDVRLVIQSYPREHHI